MSPVTYLLDEHVAKRLRRALGRIDPSIPVVRIGQPGGPAFGTLDPELVRWAEQHKCSIVSMDESTLVGEANTYVRAGGHTWGIFILRSEASLGNIVNSLAIVGVASQAEEWQDQIVYIPF